MGRKATLYLLGNLFILFTLAMLITAIACRYAPQAPITYEWIFAGHATPAIFALNICLLAWWLIRRRWLVAIIPLVALIVGATDMLLFLQPPQFGKTESGDLRVASLNVHGFLDGPSRGYSARSIATMLRDEQIDVACLQEVLDDAENPFEQMSKHFSTYMPYVVREMSMTCFSRYPILKHKFVRFPDSDQSYLWADIDINGTTVRFISVHLQTSGVSRAQRHFQKLYGRSIPLDSLTSMMAENTHIRAAQVAAIRPMIDSMAMPIVVVGDFNDTPVSHTYRAMSKGLTDAFVAAGQGWAGTYAKVLRIDYILCNDYLKPVDYSVWRKEHLSDHSPVIAEFKWIKR